jgi:hypothetical protein
VGLLRRIALTAVAVASVAGGVVSAAASTPAVTASAHWQPQTRATASTGLSDPAANVPPTPDYWPTCQSAGASSTTCFNAVLTAIDYARSLEGVGPMVLPSGFDTLTVAQQTFVVSNLERVDRGLPPALGMVDQLNSASATAASTDADPTLPGLPWVDGSFTGWTYGSIWAGDLNALAADYDWMYNDGYTPGGPNYNLDCQSATDAGCWGHRHNILGTYSNYEVVTGVASVFDAKYGWTSIAQIFVGGLGTPPPFTTSWTQVSGSTGGTSTVAGPSAASPTAPDATAVTVSAPSRITAGNAATVRGRVTDTTTSTPIPVAAVELCHHTVLSSTTTCAAYTTDSTGSVAATVKPTVSTVYWWSYAGGSAHAAAASTRHVVRVRPRLHLSTSHLSTGWRVTSHLTPARGQVVRLQRYSSSGWVTVRRTTARSWLTFTRLRRGTYRLVVASVPGWLATSGRVRAA